MTGKEMQAYRKKLLKLRQEIQDEMRKQGKEGFSENKGDFPGEYSGYSTHMADAGTDTNSMEFMGNILSSEQKTLFEIDEALIRISEGVYGKCMDCRRAISKKRLELLPHAKYCKRHEEEREKPED